MKGNPHKKMTYEDKFSRKFSCWVKNNNKAWRWWKRKNKRDFRHKMKTLLEKENI